MYLNLIIICLSLSLGCFSQEAKRFTLSGYIKEKGSQETLPGASIYAATLKEGTTSNNYGFYSITLPTDSVDLVFSYIGYKPRVYRVMLSAHLKLDIILENISDLGEVIVSAQASERISDDIQMSKIDLPVEQIKELPALLGEKDVLKAIQLLPGVQKGSEGSSGIYVRGGGPDQNLILLDNATVYNASHLFGFFSLFNGDALKSVELTKGGFPARYGGRLSSVIDMQMKDGNKEKIKGEAGIGLISSRLTLEGPLKKDKASFLISGRRTYIDVLAKPLIKKLNGGAPLGYYFYDLNAKLNYIVTSKDRLYLSGYFGKDKFRTGYERTDISNTLYQKSDADLHWGNATATFRWNRIINEKTFSNVSFIFSDYKFGVGIKEQTNNDFYHLDYSSGIRDYSLKADVDFFPNTKHLVKAGIVATYHQFRPSAVVTKSSYADPTNKTTRIDTYETAAYIEDDYKISDKWRTNIGLRITHFNVRSASYVRPEPRASVRYAITNSLSLKASYAMMNQYLHLLSNSGYGLPTDLWVPATDRIKPQQSQQGALGLAKDLKIGNMNFLLSLEGYYKNSKHVIGYKEGASFLKLSDLSTSRTSGFTYEDIVTSGSAESYGAELFFQKKAGRFTGWAGYTLSWTWMKFDDLNFGKRFPARYDRRHDISLVGIYKLKERITISAVWVYGTGNAISLPLTSYQAVDHASSYNTQVLPVSGLNVQDYGGTVRDYGEKNSFRMAPYHRLDVAVQFHKKKKNYERILEIGIYNVYNRQNPFFYRTETNMTTRVATLKQVSLFPIIPSISSTWKF